MLDLHAAGVWLQDVLLWDVGDVSAPWGASRPEKMLPQSQWPVGGSCVGGSSFTPEEVAASMCADLDLPVTVFEPLIAASIRTQVAQHIAALGDLEPPAKRQRRMDGQETAAAETSDAEEAEDESLHTLLCVFFVFCCIVFGVWFFQCDIVIVGRFGRG